MVNTQTDETNFDQHSPTAERLLRIFENFADEFSNRSVPVHLTEILRGEKYLKGKHIGQHPERFLEEYLIWPTLQALDYTFWVQPYGYPKWDKSRPDFSIRNFECGLDCAVIGEVKTPNKFDYAIADIEAYLKSDLGDPTVGFATDGIRWRVEARPERSSEPCEVVELDFAHVFERLPKRHEEGESYRKHSLRREMGDVDRLSRDAVERRAHEIFTDDKPANTVE